MGTQDSLEGWWASGSQAGSWLRRHVCFAKFIKLQICAVYPTSVILHSKIPPKRDTLVLTVEITALLDTQPHGQALGPAGPEFTDQPKSLLRPLGW